MKTLLQEDFDFSDVPESELSSCLFYEYMRESRDIIREVKNLRTHLSKESKRLRTKKGELAVGMSFQIRKVTQRPGIIFEALLFASLASVGKFPGLPWQKLSSHDKNRLQGFENKARRSDPVSVRPKEYPPLVIDTPSTDTSLGGFTLDAYKARRLAGYVEVPASKAKVRFDTEELAPTMKKSLAWGFIQINLGYDQTRLISAFRDWLKTNHPKGAEKPEERRGRKTVRDRLNRLGALRLRYHSTNFAEAQARLRPLGQKPHGAFYADRSSFNRACRAAVRHFRTLLKLPHSAFPIHFERPSEE